MSMKKEDLIYSMADIDDSFIEEADPGKAGVRAVDKQASKKISPVKRSLSKTAVAAIVAVCVLVMGGGAVWAMTVSPLKDYFFKNSEEQAFEDVYKEIGKTYTIGSHTVTLDGMTYDEATGIGYVSFSAFDAEGNPTNFIADEPRVYLGDLILNDDIWTESYKLGDDQVYFIKLNVKSCYGHTGEPTLYWQLREDRELYGSPVSFTVVDKDTLDRISDEIAHLDIELNKVYSPGKDEYLYGCVDYDKALPKVKDILNKYDLVTLDFEAMPSQVIETANCTFIFGRTDGILKYNSNEFDADSFVIKRENGKEITVEKGHVDSELWKVADLDNMSWFPDTSSDGDGNHVARYNYGFILGVDEKVSVIINGKTYK
ncbi:MAG: hypothetical protein IK007_10595 [Lachnospiraceae bacterium]|nr:hypothetical protein [Lachnospiraceae bacterium]